MHTPRKLRERASAFGLIHTHAKDAQKGIDVARSNMRTYIKMLDGMLTAEPVKRGVGDGT